jgi:hypothetical protein
VVALALAAGVVVVVIEQQTAQRQGPQMSTGTVQAPMQACKMAVQACSPTYSVFPVLPPASEPH